MSFNPAQRPHLQRLKLSNNSSSRVNRLKGWIIQSFCTIAGTMRGCLVFFVIVARAIPHDRSFRASLNMRLAPAATHSSFPIQTVRFAPSATQTLSLAL